MSIYKDFVIIATTFENYRTIGPLLEDLEDLNPKKIVIADANSEDFFKVRIREISKNAKIIESPFKKDKHNALLNALIFSKKIKAEYILTIDGDNYESKKEIKEMMDLIKKHKYILISKERKNLKRGNLIKKEISKLTNRIFYKIENKDPYTPTRVFKRNLIPKILESKNSKQFAKKISTIMKENKKKTGFVIYTQNTKTKNTAKKIDFKKIKEKLLQLKTLFKNSILSLQKTPSFMKKLFAIPNMKELGQKQQGLFIFSMLLPLVFTYAILHLYANPLGYWEKFEMGDQEIQKTMNNFFTKSNTTYLDGTTQVTISPRRDVADVTVEISIQGDENLYIIPSRIEKEDIKERMWSLEKEFEENKNHIYLDEYEVRENERYLTFKLEIKDNWEKEIEKPQIVLKYKGLQLIRHQDVFEWRRTHQNSIAERVFEDIQKDQDVQTIVGIYKQPNRERDIRGFLSLYVNEKISVEPLKNQIQNTNNISWIWSEEFKKDIEQEYISLKKDYVDIENEENKEIPQDSCIQKSKDKNYTPTCKILDEFERNYDENNRYVGSTQVFYKKEIFDNFNGKVKTISVGYDYPFEKKQNITTFQSRTPVSTTLFGEMSEVENMEVILRKDTLW